MTGQRNTAVVRRVVEEIWNHGDLDVADVLFASTYINHGGLVPDLIRGPEAMKMGVSLFRTAFPRLHVSVVGLVAHGMTVELRWSASNSAAAGTPAVSGDPPQALTGTTFGRLSHDQIVESWTFWDRAWLLNQLKIGRPEHMFVDV